MKDGPKDEWLKDIAPFVRKGSYVTMSNDDGRVWRLFFDGEQTRNIYPQWEGKEAK